MKRHLLRNEIHRHQSDKGCHKYKTYDQLVALLFGQLNKCYTLSDISCGLSISSTFFSDIDLKQSPAKSTMSDGNKNRNYRVFEGLYYRLLSYYKETLKLRHQSHVIEEIKNHNIKLIDSTTVSLCLSLFDWAKFRDILKDEIIELTSEKAIETGVHTQKLRLVHIYKEDENKVIEIITNQLGWSARTIADLYKKCWDIELFFKAMKQNLQIKTFLGTSENAMKSQIFVALISYLLLELIKRFYYDTKTAFSNFCKKVRIYLMHYLTLDYICNELKPVVKKVKKPPQKTLFDRNNSSIQMNLPL